MFEKLINWIEDHTNEEGHLQIGPKPTGEVLTFRFYGAGRILPPIIAGFAVVGIVATLRKVTPRRTR